MEKYNWKLLAELRETFLSETPSSSGDYWKTREQLEAYDATFGARIGWKWDAVLRELSARGWAPPAAAAIVDWGCGTGIASRRVIARYPVSSVWLFDRSRLAEDFAAKAISGPTVERFRGAPPVDFVLLVSHVLNELTAAGRKELTALVEAAQAVLWVEPGTPELSRQLIDLRERVRASFRVVAPCPHQARFGLLTPENARHWCHHFAAPAPEAFTDAHWARFGKELGIDLRSLPVSYLVLDRREPPPVPAPARVIGRPRRYKGYTTYLACEESGVAEKKAMRSGEPERYRELETDLFSRFL